MTSPGATRSTACTSITLVIQGRDSITAATRSANSVRPSGRASPTRCAGAWTSAKRSDLFAYTDALQDDWRAFRIARMTALMTRLGGAVKAERPTRR